MHNCATLHVFIGKKIDYMRWKDKSRMNHRLGVERGAEVQEVKKDRTFPAHSLHAGGVDREDVLLLSLDSRLDRYENKVILDKRSEGFNN